MNKQLPSYAVITPFRDEGRHIACTIKSMIRQHHLPIIWVLVDDGSTDNSAHLIRKYEAYHPWIKYLRINRDTPRRTGSAEILAFNFGMEILKEVSFDIIVKLDADLSFEEGYFAGLLKKFVDNDKLGIASGVYLEEKKGRWIPVTMPEYHAAGASKAVRAECFRQIGGFMSERGWDTVDEIKALSYGWKTTHFPELKFYHLKKEGSGMGWIPTGIMHGEIMYRTTGGALLFLFLKTVSRIIAGWPPVIGAAALFIGYWKTRLSRKPLLVTPGEAALYRELLSRRLLGGFQRATFKMFRQA